MRSHFHLDFLILDLNANNTHLPSHIQDFAYPSLVIFSIVISQIFHTDDFKETAIIRHLPSEVFQYDLTITEVVMKT